LYQIQFPFQLQLALQQLPTRLTLTSNRVSMRAVCRTLRSERQGLL
jgi:hypothetical protein